MKKLSIMTVAALAAALSTGCGSNKTALQPGALEGEWNVTTVNGQTAQAEKDVYIGIDLQENRLYGCAGCNRIMGAVNADKGKAGRLSFGQVGSTRMACNDMATEQAVLEALGKVEGYEGTEQELFLTDGKGNTLLTLSKRPTATPASLDGKWNITAVYGTPVGEIEETEQPPFLEFNTGNGSVHGNAGCNIVNGKVLTEDGEKASLKFDKMISTMMAGPGMTLEGRVMEALNKVSGFIVKDRNTAVLTDENGEEALTLNKE